MVTKRQRNRQENCPSILYVAVINTVAKINLLSDGFIWLTSSDHSQSGQKVKQGKRQELYRNTALFSVMHSPSLLSYLTKDQLLRRATMVNWAFPCDSESRKCLQTCP